MIVPSNLEGLDQGFDINQFASDVIGAARDVAVTIFGGKPPGNQQQPVVVVPQQNDSDGDSSLLTGLLIGGGVLAAAGLIYVIAKR